MEDNINTLSNRFKQKGAKDQLTAIRGAIEGTISVRDSISCVQFDRNIIILLNDLRELEKYIPNNWEYGEIIA